MRLTLAAFLAMFALTIGCGRDAEQLVEFEPVAPMTAAPSKDQPTLQIANWEETQQLVGQNSGKVVILDLWASW